MDAFAYPMMPNNDFELHDFIDDPYFDQLVDVIHGENEMQATSFITECLAPGDDVFGFSGSAATAIIGSTLASDLSFVHNSSLPSSFDGDSNVGVQEEEDKDGDDSSGGTRTTRKGSGKKPKADRARTLISERRRRGKMKEKLYALRALVPNITKMDKASIVGDAVLYVQNLQVKAKKLKAEIAELEASLTGSEGHQEPTGNKKPRARRKKNPTSKKIMQMNVFPVEERWFYVRLVSNKGEGIAVSLYKALESITSFTLEKQLRGSDQDKYSTNLKLKVTRSLVNQGFEVPALLSAC